MVKKNFLIVLAISSILLASLVISGFTNRVSAQHQGVPGSFYQQVGWSGSFQALGPYKLDCFKRYYRFNHKADSTRNQQDASNYYLTLI
jgi:hypothetical protein